MMREWKLFIYLAVINIISIGSFQLTAAAAEKSSNNTSISITSNSLEMNEAKNTIVFNGSVYADSGDSIVKCNRMEVFYIKGSSGEAEKNSDSRTIDRILCSGDVDITRSDGTSARASKAEMFQAKEILILSGNAIAFQGKNSVEGDVITLYLKEKRTVVESSSPSRVKAVVFQDGEKE